jgi:hypothetical protein
MVYDSPKAEDHRPLVLIENFDCHEEEDENQKNDYSERSHDSSLLKKRIIYADCLASPVQKKFYRPSVKTAGQTVSPANTRPTARLFCSITAVSEVGSSAICRSAAPTSS